MKDIMYFWRIHVYQKAPKEKTFGELNELLLSHFFVEKSVSVERLKFYNARKESNEKVLDWNDRTAKVESLAVNYKFSSTMLDAVMLWKTFSCLEWEKIK